MNFGFVLQIVFSLDNKSRVFRVTMYYMIPLSNNKETNIKQHLVKTLLKCCARIPICTWVNLIFHLTHFKEFLKCWLRIRLLFTNFIGTPYTLEALVFRNWIDNELVIMDVFLQNFKILSFFSWIAAGSDYFITNYELWCFPQISLSGIQILINVKI